MHLSKPPAKFFARHCSKQKKKHIVRRKKPGHRFLGLLLIKQLYFFFRKLTIDVSWQTNFFVIYWFISGFWGSSAAISTTYLFEDIINNNKKYAISHSLSPGKKRLRDNLKKCEITSAINHFFTTMTQWEVINTHKRKLFF